MSWLCHGRALEIALCAGVCWACGSSEEQSTDGGGGSAGSAATGGASGGGGTGGNGGSAGSGVSGGASGASGAGGNSGNAGSGGTAGMAADCDAFASLVCGAYQECAPFYMQVDFGIPADCASSLRGVCEHFRDAGRPLNVAACAEAIQVEDCSGVAAMRGVPNECLTPRGPQAAGAPCNWDFDCESLLCTGNAAGCGVCAARRMDGESCDDRNVCALGLVCNTGMCRPAPAAGAACSAAAGCLDGNSCVEGSCRAWGGLDAVCGPDSPCDGPNGYSCSDGRCVAIGLAGQGQDCGAAIVTNCRAGFECSAEGTCQSSSGLDDTCGMGTGCTFPLWCANGVCSYDGTSVCR